MPRSSRKSDKLSVCDELKLLVVGEASNLVGGRPFEGRSGARLASLAGVTQREFLDAVEAVNLIPFWPGRSSGKKGHLFPADAARLRAASMDLAGRRMLLCGLRVARAFGLPSKVRFMNPCSLGRDERSCHVIPHPSGIVRWWNDADNVAAATNLVRNLMYVS